MKNTTQFHIRPARPEEAGLFYTPHPEEDKRLGTVGHVRMDFGRSGNEFWHTWWPRGPEELNSPVFKAELQEVVDTLRESVLKSRFAMERFCYEHGSKISGGWTQNYGETLSFHSIVCCINRTPPAQDPPDSIITETGAEVQQLQEAKTALLDKRAKGVCSTLFLANCLRCIALLQKKLVIQPKRP